MASIELRDISLNYRVFSPVDLSVKAAVRSLATGGLIRSSGWRSVEICALTGISLTVGDGERVGLIGHNGSGKTTLLKVIAGIYRAQYGSIRRAGKTVAVINPGNGLQQDITGYENIENIGLLSGLRHSEIKARIPEIVEFTELGEFLSLPVSTYSSGMQTRLAFAVATSLNPEILIVDENIGAGDARFFERAQKRMEAMMNRSSILVLASHSLPTVQQLCRRAILLEHGRIVADGPVEQVIARYREALQQPVAA